MPSCSVKWASVMSRLRQFGGQYISSSLSGPAPSALALGAAMAIDLEDLRNFMLTVDVGSVEVKDH